MPHWWNGRTTWCNTMKSLGNKNKQYTINKTTMHQLRYKKEIVSASLSIPDKQSVMDKCEE